MIIANLEEEQKNTNDEDEQEKIQLEINYFKNDEQKMMSKSRIEKSYQAILESGLQYLLQSSITFKKVGSFGFLAIFNPETDPLIKIQLSTSLLSVVNGFMKMYEELPYQMDGEMTTNKEPINSTYKELNRGSWWDRKCRKVMSGIMDGVVKALFPLLICIRFSNLGQHFTICSFLGLGIV